MKIQGSTAFVTGANRGLGLAFAQALLAAGARKVYAGARDPASVREPGLVPVRLDVTRSEQIAEAAAQCGDVDLVINNAGIFHGGLELLSADGDASLRQQLDTNLYGMLAVSRAFAPVLRSNGGGALVNMLSALSWTSLPDAGGYSISKAAAWALSNGLRHELRSQGTLVVAVHAGYIDTDMAKGVQGPKARPEDIASATLAGIEAGEQEVLADGVSQAVKAGLVAVPPRYLGGARA